MNADLDLRADGWPLCPACGEDELACLKTPPAPDYRWSLPEILTYDLYCHRCARVTVPAGAALEAFYRRFPGERAAAVEANRALDAHLARGGSEPDWSL